MTGALGLLQLAGLTGLGFAALIALVCTAVGARAVGSLRRVPPRLRAAILTGIACAPMAGSALLLAVCFLPSALDVAGLRGDHCLRHHHHSHLCLVHRPLDAGHPAGWLLLGVVLAGAACGAGRHLWRARETSRLLRALRRTGTRDASGVRWIDAEQPVSMAAGLRRPEVVVSRCLGSLLSRPLLDAVVAHERAHVRRRDGLRLLVVRLCAGMHAPAVRRRLVAETALACEQACDEDAALVTGDRLDVASAILRVERLSTSARLGMALGMNGGDVPARIDRLLGAVEELEPQRVRWGVLIGFVALAVLAVLAAEPLHHLSETALALLG